jgi:hypothetical protein
MPCPVDRFFSVLDQLLNTPFYGIRIQGNQNAVLPLPRGNRFLWRLKISRYTTRGSGWGNILQESPEGPARKKGSTSAEALPFLGPPCVFPFGESLGLKVSALPNLCARTWT